MSADATPESEFNDQQLYARRLTPHRSLSRRGLSLLLVLVGCAGIALSIPFFLLGAWPVVGFFGLDVLIIFLAFRANTRAARAYEELNVTHVALNLRKVSAQGVARVWRFNPSWVRLKTDRHEEFGTQRIAVIEGRRQVEIGSFLGAEAKDELAVSFGDALTEARSGRVYNP